MVTDMDMDIVVKVMVTTATAAQATPAMDMGVTTSVMLRLSLAMADMAMEATPGPAMGDTVMGATPTCTDLHKDLVHHMDTDQMVTTKLNQMRPNHETSKAKKTHQ